MRRLGALVVCSAAAFAGLAMVAAPAASAHPLGNFTVNRYSGVALSPGRVEITYVVDMAEIPTFQEMPSIDVNGDGTASPPERQGWADRMGPQLMQGVSLAVDGRPVRLQIVSASMRLRNGQGGLPTLYLRAAFAGSIPRSGSVRYRDGNFGDRIGWKEVVASSADGVAISGSSVPSASVSHELLSYPVSLLSSPLDVSQASLTFRPGRSTGAAAAPIAAGRTVTGAPIASGGGFAALVTRRLTVPVAVLMLGLALVFGALHALGPGHGKSIMAAYLVGGGARVRHVVEVGLAVSLMHTASVLGLGLVTLYLSHVFPAERVYPWLGLVTGVVVAALGGGLLLVRVRGRRRGEGPRRVRPHDHAHGHEHRPLPRRGLAALAVSGGILPSPTALVVLIAAVNLHRIGYGLGLIAAFSLGLAAALIGVGLLAMRARDFVDRRLEARMAGMIPALSAALILAVGVFLTFRASMQV